MTLLIRSFKQRGYRALSAVIAIGILLCPVFRLSIFSERWALEFGDTSSAFAGARFGRYENVYCGADTEEKVIALTFDDGPHPKYTDEILDILKEYGVKGTFFVIGENVELYPEKLKRAVAEGHEIGNHTYTHPSLKNIDASGLESELKRTEEAVEKAVGVSLRLFRPPEGCCNRTIVDCANRLRYTTVLWSVDPRDWASPPVSSIVSSVKGSVGAGSILLFHDYNSSRKSPTASALKIIIPKLIEDGYSFVTVSELLNCC